MISHSTFNTSFSAFLRSIHGFRFSVPVILSSKSVSGPHSRSNHARFAVLASRLRGFRFHATVSFPQNRSVSSESVWFLLNTFGFQETARKRKVGDVLYGAMITFHGNVPSDLRITGLQMYMSCFISTFLRLSFCSCTVFFSSFTLNLYKKAPQNDVDDDKDLNFLEELDDIATSHHDHDNYPELTNSSPPWMTATSLASTPQLRMHTRSLLWTTMMSLY
ncbi:hypothetical protein E2542_SST20798 [Spatholobus suberectus]|nr:hypothetical protein E2542_SST20798 [Spatholobus suberectus]